MSQFVGSFIGASVAVVGGFIVYGVVRAVAGIRLSPEEEYEGADLAIHKIGANSAE